MEVVCLAVATVVGPEAAEELEVVAQVGAKGVAVMARGDGAVIRAAMVRVA